MLPVYGSNSTDKEFILNAELTLIMESWLLDMETMLEKIIT